ncbi:hypothetical protein [Microbulbifer sp. TYP-18]|uniref:hypothetical protein n=1 Tax=Microbulbifer sp. TYP-18 TaxID=3230024 RepID=UPI0034C5FB70
MRKYKAIHKMKNILGVAVLLFSFSSNAFAGLWTVDIEQVLVWNTERAEIIVANPRDPNPVGSTWDCDINKVLLGDPVADSMLSTALMAYAAGKVIRISVNGSGTSCSAIYIQVLKQ